MIITVVLLKRQTPKHKWLSKCLQKGNKSCQNKKTTYLLGNRNSKLVKFYSTNFILSTK